LTADKNKKTHINNMSWIKGIRLDLSTKEPVGWIVLTGIEGRGIQLLPFGCVYLNHNSTDEDLHLVGKYKIVFEFFRLDNSRKVKISARVAGIEGDPLFHEFWGIARGLGCPKPKSTKKRNTQSVAAWPKFEERQIFDKADHVGMADWIRHFLCNPPADFTLFLAAVRNLLASK